MLREVVNTGELIQKIDDALESLREETIVETNEGTFGAAECCRVVGCGDPVFGNYRIVESTTEGRKLIGCDPEKAPGRPRKFNLSREFLKKRKKAESLLELRRSLKRFESERYRSGNWYMQLPKWLNEDVMRALK